MDNGRYIWCRNCGAIHHVTAFDRYPIYALEGGERRRCRRTTGEILWRAMPVIGSKR